MNWLRSSSYKTTSIEKEINMTEDNKLTLISEDGSETICEVLFTHENSGKNYVVFEIIESGEITAAVYEPDADESEGAFKDIETDEEWDMLDRLLDNFYQELEEKDNE